MLRRKFPGSLKFSLVQKWVGNQAAAPSVLFIAPYDVVPAEDITRNDRAISGLMRKLIPLAQNRCILGASCQRRTLSVRRRMLTIASGASHAAQGFEVELGRRGFGGSTDRDGVSKRWPRIGSARPRYVRTHRGQSPGLLTKEWGRNFPASFVGPPTAAKIRPVSCGRAALPHVRSRGSEAVTPPCAWK